MREMADAPVTHHDHTDLGEARLHHATAGESPPSDPYPFHRHAERDRGPEGVDHPPVRPSDRPPV